MQLNYHNYSREMDAPLATNLLAARADVADTLGTCGWSGPPFRWDEECRFLLRCEWGMHIHSGGVG